MFENPFYYRKKQNSNSCPLDSSLHMHCEGVSNPFYISGPTPTNQSRTDYPVGKINVSFYDRYGCNISALLYYPAGKWNYGTPIEGSSPGSTAPGHAVDAGSLESGTFSIWPAGAPPFADDGPFPVIIYGPGLFCVKKYYDWMGNLASQGIAVLIIDFVNNNGFHSANNDRSETVHSRGLGAIYPNASPYPSNWPDLWPWVYELVDSVDWIRGYIDGGWKRKSGDSDHVGDFGGPTYINYPPSRLWDLSNHFGSIYLAGHSTGATMGLVASSFDDRIVKIIPMASYDEGGAGVNWQGIDIQAKPPYPSDHADNIGLPVLLMAGEHDVVCPPCNNQGDNSNTYDQCNNPSNSYMTYNNLNCDKCHCLFLNNNDNDSAQLANHQSWCDKNTLNNGPGSAYCETIQGNARNMINYWIKGNFADLKSILVNGNNKIYYVTNIASLQSRSSGVQRSTTYNRVLYNSASGGIAHQNVPAIYRAPKIAERSQQSMETPQPEIDFSLLRLYDTVKSQIVGGIFFLEEQRGIQSLENNEILQETIHFASGEMPAYEWASNKKNDPHNPFNCNFQTMYVLQSMLRMNLIQDIKQHNIDKKSF